jgi:hypothetical protein
MIDYISLWSYKSNDVDSIVADPGCLSRIRIFSIADPHQKII